MFFKQLILGCLCLFMVSSSLAMMFEGAAMGNRESTSGSCTAIDKTSFPYRIIGVGERADFLSSDLVAVVLLDGEDTIINSIEVGFAVSGDPSVVNVNVRTDVTPASAPFTVGFVDRSGQHQAFEEGVTYNREAFPLQGEIAFNPALYNPACPSSGETTATQFLMTTSSSVNQTELHIVNNDVGPQQFTGTLYSGDGEMLGQADRVLADSVIRDGRVVLTSRDLETIFSTSAWKGPAMLEVKGQGSFSLMSKLTSPSGLVSNTNCVTTGSVHNIEDTSSSGRTFVRFINTTDETLTNIRGVLYDQSGNRVNPVASNSELFGSVLIESLAPKAAVWINNQSLENTFGTWSGTADLEVTSTSPDGLKLLNLNFVNEETFFNFSCFEASS